MKLAAHWGKWKRMKRKTEIGNGKAEIKLGNGRHNCSKRYLLRMRELCAYPRAFLLTFIGNYPRPRSENEARE